MLEKNIARRRTMDKLLNLRYPAVAIKFIEDESDVPEDALRPMRDMGKHLAICQAYAISRRQGKSVYMSREDHWCWNPLITYGMVEFERGRADFELLSHYIGISDKEKASDFIERFPKLPLGKYCGTLCAPLDKADFEPDVMLIYCRNYQLRFMLMGIVNETGEMLESSFTPLDSCTYSVVKPYLEGKYRITIPDPGEYERALVDENEIIFSVPRQRMDEYFAALAHLEGRGQTVDSFKPIMKEDFQRPPFYNKVFEMWGLEQGETIKK